MCILCMYSWFFDLFTFLVKINKKNKCKSFFYFSAPTCICKNWALMGLRHSRRFVPSVILEHVPPCRDLIPE